MALTTRRKVTCDPNSTSDEMVKLSVPALILLAAIRATIASGQVRPNEPTKEEIAQAYRSKSGGTGTYIPRHEWEHWRIKEIRGWKLHFKRISEKRFPGVIQLPVRARRQKEQPVCGVRDN